MAYNYTDVVFPLKGLSPTDKLVLLHLAEHADKDTGECWPGFGRLADFTGLTRRTVIYSINRLEELEFITVTPPATRKTNTYVVRMDKLVAASVTATTKRAKRKYTRRERVVASPSASWKPLFAEGCDYCNQSRPDCKCPAACPQCGYTCDGLGTLANHIQAEHPSLWAEVSNALGMAETSKGCCTAWPD